MNLRVSIPIFSCHGNSFIWLFSWFLIVISLMEYVNIFVFMLYFVSSLYKFSGVIFEVLICVWF